jgi:hypothetical protein
MSGRRSRRGIAVSGMPSCKPGLRFRYVFWRVMLWVLIVLGIDRGCGKDDRRWKDELYYLCDQDRSEYIPKMSSPQLTYPTEPRMPSPLLGIRLPPHLPRRPLPRPHRPSNPIETIPHRLRRKGSKQGERGCDGYCTTDEDAGGFLEEGCKASDFERGACFSSVFG